MLMNTSKGKGLSLLHGKDGIFEHWKPQEKKLECIKLFDFKPINFASNVLT